MHATPGFMAIWSPFIPLPQARKPGLPLIPCMFTAGVMRHSFAPAMSPSLRLLSLSAALPVLVAEALGIVKSHCCFAHYPHACLDAGWLDVSPPCGPVAAPGASLRGRDSTFVWSVLASAVALAMVYMVTCSGRGKRVVQTGQIFYLAGFLNTFAIPCGHVAITKPLQGGVPHTSQYARPISQRGTRAIRHAHSTYVHRPQLATLDFYCIHICFDLIPGYTGSTASCSTLCIIGSNAFSAFVFLIFQTLLTHALSLGPWPGPTPLPKISNDNQVAAQRAFLVSGLPQRRSCAISLCLPLVSASPLYPSGCLPLKLAAVMSLCSSERSCAIVPQ